MAEGTYEYECMRAELLGIEKPDYEEFTKKDKINEKAEIEEEESDTEKLKEVNLEEEGITKVSGKLDELNSILKKTQSKINRMKASCGSVAGLLKNRLGSFSSQSSFDSEPVEQKEPTEANGKHDETEDEPTTTNNYPTSSHIDIPVRKSDLQKALDKDLSALDKMIEKAENSQYAISHQTKEMKKFIK